MTDWKKAFRPGGVISYDMRPENGEHHVTTMGKAVFYNQSFHPFRLPSVTHVGVINCIGTEIPAPGLTQLHAIEILQGGIAGDRVVERNYGLNADILKENLVLSENPRIMSDDFLKTALEVAKRFTGVSYDLNTALKTAFFPQRNVKTDAAYTQALCKQYNIDPANGTFTIDTSKHKVICSELVVTSYQIAWLLMAGPDAANKPFPAFIDIHARCAAAGLIEFMRDHPEYYECVSLETTHQLMYSGTPHPNDPPTDPEKHYGQDEIKSAECIGQFVGSFNKARPKL